MDHSIQECLEFLELVQEMINEGEMEFCGKMEEQNVSVLLKEVPKAVTIFYRRGGQQATKEAPHVPTPRLVVKVPVSLRYASVTPQIRDVTGQRQTYTYASEALTY